METTAAFPGKTSRTKERRTEGEKEGGERSLHHEVTCTGYDFTLHDLVPLSVSQTHSPTLSLLSDRALAFVRAHTRIQTPFSLIDPIDKPTQMGCRPMHMANQTERECMDRHTLAHSHTNTHQINFEGYFLTHNPQSLHHTQTHKHTPILKNDSKNRGSRAP